MRRLLCLWGLLIFLLLPAHAHGMLGLVFLADLCHRILQKQAIGTVGSDNYPYENGYLSLHWELLLKHHIDEPEKVSRAIQQLVATKKLTPKEFVELVVMTRKKIKPDPELNNTLTLGCRSFDLSPNQLILLKETEGSSVPLSEGRFGIHTASVPYLRRPSYHYDYFSFSWTADNKLLIKDPHGRAQWEGPRFTASNRQEMLSGWLWLESTLDQRTPDRIRRWMVLDTQEGGKSLLNFYSVMHTSAENWEAGFSSKSRPDIAKKAFHLSQYQIETFGPGQYFMKEVGKEISEPFAAMNAVQEGRTLKISLLIGRRTVLEGHLVLPEHEVPIHSLLALTMAQIRYQFLQ